MARAPESDSSKKGDSSRKAKSSSSSSSAGAAAAALKPKASKIDKVKSAATTSSSKNEAIPSSKSVLRESRPASSSVMNAAEQDFPRGAAPKTARAPVAAAKPVDNEPGLFKDGLFSSKDEASSSSTKKRRNPTDGPASTDATASTKSTKKRKMINKNDKKINIATPHPSSADTFRVEHMSYKRLLPGPTVLLVQIVAVLPLELIVSMPSQLLGHVPITNISKAYTKRLEEDLEQSSDEEEDEEEEDDSDAEDGAANSQKLPALSDMFHVGQYLRAAVEKVLPPKATAALVQSFGRQRGNEDWKASRRCELTLEPERVNAGVSKADLKIPGLCLQGSVKSVEDNGYIVEFGLKGEGTSKDDAGITSFVSFKDEKKAKKDSVADWPKHRLTLGGIVFAKVQKMADNGRTVSLSVVPSEVSAVQLTVAPTITSLLPGTLVQSIISAITPSGLSLKFLGFFEGTVDTFHLPLPSSSYKVGQKVAGRILWTCPPTNDSPIRFAFSLMDHIVALVPRQAPLQPGNPNSELGPISQVLPTGTFLENIEIVKVEPEWGLLCTVPGTDLKAFVHISHVSDEHLTSLSGTQWKAGTSGYKGRVIGYSAFDGLLQVSLQPSVLDRTFMKVSDLKIGQTLDGTVQRLSDSALFVNIHGSVAGIVWPLHYSDLKLKHPERKFKPGGAVKSRVLSIDAEKNRVVLTLKRSLVNSDLPVFQSLEEAEEGVVVHATVHTFLQKDMLVELFGGMRAYVPISEAADHFVADIKKQFNIGQVIKVRITNVDIEVGRLTASAKQALDTYKPKQAGEAKKGKGSAGKEQPKSEVVLTLSVGDKVSGTISEIHESQVLLALEGHEGVKALLSLSSMAKNRSTDIESLRTELTTGEEISNLVVVSINPEKGLVILGHPVKSTTSLFSTTQNGISANSRPSLTFDDLEEGQILEGTLGDQNPQGYFVQLAKGIRGKVRWSELGDDYDAVNAISLQRGTVVKVIIVEYDEEAKKIDLSMRASRMQDDGDEDEDAEVTDPVVESIEELEDGQAIRGFVRSVSDAGVFVDLGKDLTARVQIKELFDEFVKNWKPRFAVGQLVSGKILSTNKAKKQIEMTLRKNASAKRAKKDNEPSVTFEGLSEGQVIKGIVKRIENYGAFIRLQSSHLSGLCHKSQFSNEKGEEWQKLIHVGDTVKAVITELNAEKQKISLSMKPSLMPEASDEDEEGDVNYREKLNKLVEMQEAASDEDDKEEEDSDDELQILMGEEGADALDDDEDEEASDDEEADDLGVTAPATQPAPQASALKLSAFSWDGQTAHDAMEVDEAGSDEEEEESDEDDTQAAKAKNKKNGILINDKTGDLAKQTPKSPSDFDRLLLASPNSSYLWIQYMSYFLELSDTEQARQIAQRALKTINYREEEEKLNVWVALVNLENTFGTEDTLDETVNKALQVNDPKRVYLRATEVFEATGKYEKEQELFERFVKKFNTSSKAWTLYGQFFLNRGKANEARDLLPRSLKSLPKRKHVKTISQFALMEFRLGDSERARTIFEGIVDAYSKRLDLWWIYIDQEIRLRNVVGVRALFDRVLATKLSSKKTKSVFKKWLAFEKQHGDEAGAETVKQRAIAYVQSLQDRE